MLGPDLGSVRVFSLADAGLSRMVVDAMTPTTSLLLDQARRVWRNGIDLTLTDTLECETIMKVLAACESDGREVDGDMEAYVTHRLDTLRERS
jgi:hypothetical protein